MPRNTRRSKGAQVVTNVVHTAPSSNQNAVGKPDVQSAGIKSVMITHEKTPQAKFQVLFPRPNDSRIGVMHARQEQLQPRRANLRSGSGQEEWGFQLMVVLAEKDSDTDRVVTEKVVIIEFPNVLFKHAVHLFRDSRTFEVWEEPLAVRKKNEVGFRRWAFLLDPTTMWLTKPFMDYLERQFRGIDEDRLKLINSAPDIITRPLSVPRVLLPPQPDKPVIIRFDKVFKKGLCFTGFLASKEMQKYLREASGDSSAEDPVGESEKPEPPGMENMSRGQKRRYKQKQARKAAAERRIQDEKNREAKKARGGKRMSQVIKKAKKGLDLDAEPTSATNTTVLDSTRVQQRHESAHVRTSDARFVNSRHAAGFSQRRVSETSTQAIEKSGSTFEREEQHSTSETLTQSAEQREEEVASRQQLIEGDHKLVKPMKDSSNGQKPASDLDEYPAAAK
ncbi:MAG: hypothetical protein Q9216_000649 [Gyalolechia sp. 2 TL-2023]